MVPGEIDATFLKAFRNVIKKYLGTCRFFIFVGGGKTARNYSKAIESFGADSKESDWIGIDATRLNAKLVKQAFGEWVYAEVVTNPSKKLATKKDVIVGGGWKPGWSTDYCAVTLAKNMGIKTIINMSNIDYVYDKDPKKFKNAKAIKEIDWKSFRKILPIKWSPGLSAPFDPVASRDAEVLKIKVVILNGAKLDRLENFLNGKSFIGTTIN